MSIMLGVTGAIFALVNPCQGTFRVLPEVADMQQRPRVAADMLHSHLLMAGAECTRALARVRSYSSSPLCGRIA